MAVETFTADSRAPAEATAVPAQMGPTRFGAVILVLALLATLTTFLVLAGLTPLVPTHGVVVSMLCINIAFGVLLLGMIVWQARALFLARQHKVAGAKLYCRDGGKTPDMLVRVLRTSPGDPELVRRGIDWLELNWGAEVVVPGALLGYGTKQAA